MYTLLIFDFKFQDQVQKGWEGVLHGNLFAYGARGENSGLCRYDFRDLVYPAPMLR